NAADRLSQLMKIPIGPLELPEIGSSKPMPHSLTSFRAHRTQATTNKTNGDSMVTNRILAPLGGKTSPKHLTLIREICTLSIKVFRLKFLARLPKTFRI